MTEKKERALLLGVDLHDGEDFERSMQELKSLAQACGMEAAGQIVQNLDKIHPALYMGKGKLQEIRGYLEEEDIGLLIFDRALTPSQMKNLQDFLGCPILDRTTLILEIFASRAQTREAKLQVESARLQYILPRLVGMRRALSRQGGGSGSLSNRGAGETKLELDRRRIEKRLSQLRRELDKIADERRTQRKQRQGSGIPRVALVGYTNAGKSTLMNRMLERYMRDDSKKVLEKDMLFATLDTTVRRIRMGRGEEILLSDTVGFIRQLPAGLVKAFRSTLEEAAEADLLLHVLDYSDDSYRTQRKVTEETLKELGAGDIPVIYIYNKADLCMKADELPVIRGSRIYLSAKSGAGIAELAEMIRKACEGKTYDKCRYL